MKFNYLYNLICEDKIDDLIVKDPSLLQYKDVLKEIYTDLPEKIKKHNKFKYFLEFLIKHREELNDWKVDTFTILAEDYLKYNIDLSKHTIKSLVKYCQDKTNELQLVIDPNLAKKIYEDEEKIVIFPYNQEAIKKYGSDTWCIYKQEELWYQYILDASRAHYIVIYKTSAAIWYNVLGSPKNMRISMVQIDLNDNFFITDIGNTVGRGIQNQDAYDVLEFMKLENVDIFENYDDMPKEEFKKFIDKNDKWTIYLKSNHKIYDKIIKTNPELFDVIMLSNQWFKLAKTATRENKEEELLKLLDFGIDVNIQDSKGKTALSIMSAQDEVSITNSIDLLLDQSNIDVNIQDKEAGATALIWAIVYKNMYMYNKLLARQDIKVNIQDVSGKTALHYAALYNCYDALEKLLQRKDIDATLVSNAFRTPYQLADEKGRKIFKKYNKAYLSPESGPL